jgi:hypothetical protein
MNDPLESIGPKERTHAITVGTVKVHPFELRMPLQSGKAFDSIRRIDIIAHSINADDVKPSPQHCMGDM